MGILKMPSSNFSLQSVAFVMLAAGTSSPWLTMPYSGGKLYALPYGKILFCHFLFLSSYCFHTQFLFPRKSFPNFQVCNLHLYIVIKWYTPSLVRKSLWAYSFQYSTCSLGMPFCLLTELCLQRALRTVATGSECNFEVLCLHYRSSANDSLLQLLGRLLQCSLTQLQVATSRGTKLQRTQMFNTWQLF
jgi:hypothetical protein